jgi:hypothetical protein
MIRSLEDLRSRTTPLDECWIWSGGLTQKGYGFFIRGRKKLRVHRLALELTGVRVTSEDLVLHSCDRPACCNPAHLRVGTHEDNVRDAMDRNRVACGTRKKNAKLTDERVRVARADYSHGATVSSLAKRFSVDYRTMKDVVLGRAWKHVNAEGLSPSRGEPFLAAAVDSSDSS